MLTQKKLFEEGVEENNMEKLKISDLPLIERPSYKIERIPAAMSSRELLALLIGGEKQMDVAGRLYKACRGDLRKLGREYFPETIRGIGKATSDRILAAVQLGQRLSHPSPNDHPTTSGSIKPYRSILAAVTLALMKAAREEERRFVAIPFSGEGEYQVFDLGPEPTPQQLLDLIQFGYWGGTEPYQPLEEALEIIRDDDTLQKADILFLTDGKFRDPPSEFLRSLDSTREDVGVSLVSLLLFASNPHCEQFSDRVVSAMRLDDRGSLRMAFEEVFRHW